MNRRRSLRTNLFAATVLVVVLSIGIMLVIGALLTRRQVEHATLQGLSHQADVLAGRELGTVFPLVRLNKLNPVLKAQQEKAYAVRLKRPSPYLSDADRAVLRRGGKIDGTERVGSVEYFVAARQVGPQALVLLRPRSRGNSAFYPFLIGLLLAAGAGIGLAAIAAYVLARRISRPVQRVVVASRRLADEREPEPVPVEGAYEIAMLARSFNEMAEQLGQAREAEKQFLLSVSHELKTPLTAIRGYAEGVTDEAFEPQEAADIIAVEAARLERLVRDLLDLARMNRTDFSIHREPIDLAEIARDVVRRYEGQAREFEVTLEAFAPTEAPAIGDHDRVLQVASNLVENALRLTPPGGVVRVGAEQGALVVEDSGPGLQEEELPHAFERFFLYSRYASDRSVGTGLGLSIVKELTQGMGGSVAVESTPGRGTRFTVRLPGGFTDGLPATNRRLTSAVNDQRADSDQEVLT
jgi:two-component system, OmpR family, sensor kinase